MSDIINLFTQRRSVYNLGTKTELKEKEISDIISHALKHCPSAFNSQSARIVILYNDSYQKLWDIVLMELSKFVPDKKMPDVVLRIKSFTTGIGTVLFFEDEATIKNLKKEYPIYQENFDSWALQASGMLQYMVWQALADKNLGASLQHYNPLIDDEVKTAFDIPQSWKLIAQMPFGSINRPADKKTFKSIDDRIKIFK